MPANARLVGAACQSHIDPMTGGKVAAGHRTVLVPGLTCLRREREDRRRIRGRAGVERGGREIRLVRRVREVLGLERVARALPVCVTADTDERAGQEVAAVELDAGLVGPDGHLAPAAGVAG